MNKSLFVVFISLIITSCGGLNTFHEYARAGDTVAVPVGMQTNFSKDNITVTITPSTGADIVLAATDPTIRGIMNLYPDPVSNMLVSRAINENTTPNAQIFADSLLLSSSFNKDWFQTTVFLDLPASLPVGTTTVEINNGLGDTHSVSLEIIAGTGSANTFNSDFNGGLLLSADMMDSLSRASHNIITLDSATIPHAVELTFTHDPDSTAGGSGKAFVVNPLGYLKNISWSDDGTTMKIIIMQSKDGIIDDMTDYKFYITGTTTNLALVSTAGYDINGDSVVGVSTTITVSN